jgi:hypothetical protein
VRWACTGAPCSENCRNGQYENKWGQIKMALT